MTLPPSLPSNPSQLLQALSDKVSAVEVDGSLHIILAEAELVNVSLTQFQKLACVWSLVWYSSPESMMS